jgi:hypothetical protein
MAPNRRDKVRKKVTWIGKYECEVCDTTCGDVLKIRTGFFSTIYMCSGCATETMKIYRKDVSNICL